MIRADPLCAARNEVPVLALLAVVCCLVSIVPTNLSAQCVVYSDYIRVLGSTDGLTEGLDVVIEGDFAYVADFTSGVRILNVSDPSNPTVVNRLITLWIARGVDCESGRLFVARGGGGLIIYDLDDPTNPAFLSEISLPGISVSVVVRGARAYVISEEYGLFIVDVSNPSAPQIVGTLDTPGIGGGLVVDGDRILLADGSAGLHIVDISDESVPVIVNTVNTPGSAFQVTLRGDVAYVADRNGGVKVVALATTPPSIVATITMNFGDECYDVLTVDNRLLVVSFRELRTFEISNPVTPVEIGSFHIWGWSIAASDHWVAIVSDRGLFTVALDNLASPPVVLTDYDPDPMHWLDLAFQGNYAFVASGPEGIVVLDVADPSLPHAVESVLPIRSTSHLAVDRGRLYVADSRGFQVYDCEDPRALHLLSTLPGNWPFDVAVHGDYVFAGQYPQSLSVIDVHDPTAPHIAATFPQYLVSGFSIVGTTLYVLDYYLGLLIFDIADAASPVLIGELSPFPAAAGIAVEGSFAYVAQRLPQALSVVRVADPQSPTLISQIPTLDVATDVVVGSGCAYVATRVGGVQVVDVRHPTAPYTIGWHDVPPSALRVKLYGEMVWVTGDQLDIIPTQCRPVALAISGFRGTYEAGAVRLGWTSTPHQRFKVFRTGVEDLESQFAGEAECNGDGDAMYFESPPQVGPLRYELGMLFDDVPDPSLGSVLITIPSGEFPALSFEGPFPNPAVSISEFVLTLRDTENVHVGVYDVSGRLVRMLVNERRDPGDHAVVWDGKDGFGRGVGAGVYFVNLSSGRRTESRKVVLRGP